MEAYWSRFAHTYDRDGEYVVGRPVIEAIVERLQRERRLGEVLELGCGTGFFTKAIAGNSDLVIATADGNKRTDVEMLEEAGIPVYVLNPRRVREILDAIERVGDICGVAYKARARVASLRGRIERVTGAVRGRGRPLVFLVINVKPLLSVNRSTTL